MLLVAVCAGFGGQKYIDEVDIKIMLLADMRKKKNLNFEIQVDGGINEDNAKKKHELGADTAVAGSMFFMSEDINATMKRLK